MSITLLDVINGTNGANRLPIAHHATLVYGPPKTGKTELIATIATSTHFDTIYWFDTENGVDTLKRMHREGKLTDEQIAKIVYIKLIDTKDAPEALNTLLKSLCTRQPVNICQVDGLIDSVEGKSKKWPFIKFHYAALNSRCAIVIDSLSQVGQSAAALATQGKPTEYKLQLDDYGAMGKWLADLLSTIQAAKYCYFFCISHEVMFEEEGKSARIVPMCGTKTFSNTVGKYFGTQIYLALKAKKHTAVSTTTSTSTAQAGSRLGIVLDGQKELNLGEAMDNANFFVPDPITDDEELTELKELKDSPVSQVTPAAPEKQSGLSALERLRANKTQ